MNFSDQTPTRNMIYKRDGYSCQYCGSTRNLTIDHVIPRSKGGQDTWENLVACCDKCNVSKGNKYLHETNMKLRSKPKAPISSVMLELERTKIDEWKQFVFE
jgi:5-methylcytosine-specific restriction endonuclease McrA